MGKMIFCKTSGGRECAVYKIENMRNGKVYIGQSRCIGLRRSSHIQLLKAQKHHSKQMQADWDNGDTFKFSVLEMFPECVTTEYLSAKETMYIRRYHSIDNGYNTNQQLNTVNCKSMPDKYTISIAKISSLIGKINRDKVTFLRIKLICDALHCQPGDIMEYVEDGSGDNAAADGKE